MMSNVSQNPGYILSFEAPAATLPAVGGKGANLARLAQAGLPVPPGFLVTVAAYQAYVAENRLEARIQKLVAGLDGKDPSALEQASAEIRAMFAAGFLPEILAEELKAAYLGLGGGEVAVRSSATAEDLPEMSFAGQQDTYLNIDGEEALLRAAVNCWASLWTARAIGYRTRNNVAQDAVSIAVVVQRMVASEVSGVLFTANPLTGSRVETVIDAVYGLGEALVSGAVEPDHYVVDALSGAIRSKKLGRKAISIHPKPGGGTAAVEQDRSTQQALADEEILALARQGQQVAELYGSPQDIEWAWAEGKLHLLQARPVTSLYPLLDSQPLQPLKVCFSFAAVQGVMDPVSPLGTDFLKLFFATGARMFGIRKTLETQTVLLTAGERLWVNITTPLRNTVGRTVVKAAMGMAEPSTGQALAQIWDEPELQPGQSGLSAHARLQLLRGFGPIAGNALLNLAFPRQRREYIVANGENILHQIEKQRAAIQGDRYQRLDQAADILPDLAKRRFIPTLRLFLSAVVAGMASWNWLHLLAKSVPATVPEAGSPDWKDVDLKVTRGMPNNPTTQMDLDLWAIAQAVRADPPSQACLNASSPAQLSALYQAGNLPSLAQERIAQFMARYGLRGFTEIDLGRERWNENPLHVFEMLSSFLRIEDQAQAPDVIFANGARTAAAAIDQIAAALRKTKGSWFKAPLARWIAGRARQFMGVREAPKFFAVRMLGVVRGALLELGVEFVQSGELSDPGDFFFLRQAELKAFAAREERDWKGLIAQRRENYRRESQRKQIPRLLLSDGRAFYEGMRSSGAGGMSGSPVSPGRAEGRVRVVLDPRQANLQPGEILVCPGTDPSWTPLFLSAAGLVMEVGGMMTHGAVVAREYGIPAIVGVHEATTRLQTGQRIAVDGSSGQIELLDE